MVSGLALPWAWSGGSVRGGATGISVSLEMQGRKQLSLGFGVVVMVLGLAGSVGCEIG